MEKELPCIVYLHTYIYIAVFFSRNVHEINKENADRREAASA